MDLLKRNETKRNKNKMALSKLDADVTFFQRHSSTEASSISLENRRISEEEQEETHLRCN